MIQAVGARQTWRTFAYVCFACGLLYAALQCLWLRKLRIPHKTKALQKHDRHNHPDELIDDPTAIPLVDQRPQRSPQANRRVIALRKSLKKTEDEAMGIQQRINAQDTEVRSLLRDGRRPEALRMLKKKKLSEKALAQKDVVIENISGMLFKLENSENDTRGIWQ